MTVVLSPDSEAGGYTVSVPAAPGAGSQGDTREDALAMVTDAIEGWIEVAAAHGRGLLPETTELVAAEIEAVLGFREEFGWDRAIETATVTVRVPVVA